MKRNIPVILALIGSLLIIGFLAWAFGQHGTIGLYRVNGTFRLAFLLLGVIGLVLLLLAAALQWMKLKEKQVGRCCLSIIAVVLFVPAVIIPLVVFTLVSGLFSPGIGDTPPQLLMAEGTGEYGIPDMVLTFTTKTATKNTLHWGRETTAMTALPEDTPSGRHVFELTDLLPDSTYVYRVNDGPPVSFSTPPADGALHFAVASDAHFGAGTARSDLTVTMLDAIAAPQNDFDAFFFLGDLVEYGFQSSQWQQAFTAFSQTTSTIPVSFAAGNHDTLFSGTGVYKNYCYPEEIGAQTCSRLWYRIDAGDVHFLVLDVEWSAESFTPWQSEWLENQLRSIPADDWKIVMSHGFYYCSGLVTDGWEWYDNPETIERITPLFKEYNVDLVFSGHNHRLELLENSGIVYAICGAFGALPDPPNTYTSPASLWGISGGYGFIDVTLSGDQCTLVFRDPGYEVLKTYSFDKS